MNQSAIWIGAFVVVGLVLLGLRRRKKPKSRIARLQGQEL